MLRLRILSAALLIPIVVGAILYLPTSWLQLASAIVFAGAAWEWISIVVPRNAAARLVLLLLLILCAASIVLSGVNLAWVYAVTLFCWAGAIFALQQYPRGKEVFQADLLQPIIGLVLFVPPWLAFDQLQFMDRRWTLLGCCLIWAADVGAYTFGKLFGKGKLLVNVSPNKTIAGVYGAFVFGLLTMLIGYKLAALPVDWPYALVLAFMTVTFAIVGDLFESLIKRVYGVKDSGNLIPGHGGVFDRVDSMLSGLPIYYLGLINFHLVSIMAL